MAQVSRSLITRHYPQVSKRALTITTLPVYRLKPNGYTLNIFSQSIIHQKSKGIPGVAAFHGSGSKCILPPLPQVVNGTANDPAPVPAPEPSHGSYHWTFERLISAGLIPLTIAPFAAGSLNPTMDAILCATILIHSHIGFQSVIIDYLPRKRVPNARLAFWWGLRAATIGVGIGLYEFETNDVGVTAAISRIWRA